MLKREILGEEIWEVDPAEAKKLWRSHPDDRWRLWDHDEITAHLLDTPEQLAACIASKKEKPGRMG